jgi:hypothetical protein
MNIQVLIASSIAAVVLSSPIAQTACAQEAAEVGSEDAVPAAKVKKPLDIHGCWTGPMSDTLSGAGTITFTIKQNKTVIVKDTGHNHGSRVDVVYQPTGFAQGPISGKIIGTAITFTANFGTGVVVRHPCSGVGAATVAGSNEITGILDYENCAVGFGHVTYQVSHCP